MNRLHELLKKMPSEEKSMGERSSVTNPQYLTPGTGLDSDIVSIPSGPAEGGILLSQQVLDTKWHARGESRSSNPPSKA